MGRTDRRQGRYAQVGGVARSAARRVIRYRSVAVVVTALVFGLINVPATFAAQSVEEVNDRFQRVVAEGWGGTPATGRYGLSGHDADFSVDGSRGSILVPRGTRREATLPAIVARDVDVRFRVSADRPATGNGRALYATLRRSHELTGYRLGLRVRPGAASVIAAAVVNGRRTEIARAELGDAFLGTGFVWIRAQVTGTDPATVRVKVWRDGQAQPGSWTVTGTDGSAALQRQGSVGVRAYVSARADDQRSHFRFDDLSVKDLRPDTDPEPTPDPTPTPGPTPTPRPTPTPTPTPTPSPTPDDAFYVAPSGSDTNPGSQSLPWRTLQKAADTVPAGARVLIRSGVYEPFVLRRSGTSGEPIVFAAFQGDDRPVIAGNASTLNVVRLIGVHDVRISGVTVRGAAVDRTGSGIRIENSTRIEIVNNLLTQNRSYGVQSYNSTYVTIRGNEAAHNAVGIFIFRGGEGTVVSGNSVHHQDSLVMNSVEPRNDDHGAVGINFVKTTGHILAEDNVLWGNRAPSYDYGWDGGAFEIFGASNVTMINNRMWDNRNVLETGRDAEMGCANNVFARNVAYGATTADRSVGLMLRCDVNTKILNNTFYGLDDWVFTISPNMGSFGGSIEGLVISNNVMYMKAGKVYAFMTAMPVNVSIDRNVVYHAGGGTLAYVAGRGSTSSLATLNGWTGFEASGINSDPRFRGPATYDLQLTAASTAVDAGLRFAGITDGFAGSGPDIGRYELGD